LTTGRVDIREKEASSALPSQPEKVSPLGLGNYQLINNLDGKAGLVRNVGFRLPILGSIGDNRP
jgi:hypothetical protein